MQRQRHLTDQRLHAVDAAEAAHQLLERQRPAGGVQGHDLAVEHERRAIERLSDRHHVGQATRDVRQAPRPDRDAITLAVDLHAGAVVLELERGAPAVGAQDVTEVGGDLGQHRQQRHEGSRSDAGQRGRTATQREHGHGREIAEEERRAPHGGQVRAGGGGDRFQHETIGHAGAHLPADDPAQELTLLARSPSRQLRQRGLAGPSRAAAHRRGDGAEGRADIAQRQRSARPLAHAARKAPHAEHPGVGRRKRVASEERHRQRDFVRLDRAEKIRHQATLVEAAGTRFQSASQRGEVGQQGHDVILERDSPAAPRGECSLAVLT